jgi:hypothetical protein
LADLDGERAMVLAGAAEHVKVEEQVAGLKGGNLGAAAAAHGSEDGCEGVTLLNVGSRANTPLFQ